jgi:hypothetical protein
MISFSAKAQRSWNMREAAKRAADVHLQNALLSSHQTYLQILDHTVQTSRAAIIRQIETSVIQNITTPSKGALVSATTCKMRCVQTKTKRQSSRKLRLALPRWLTDTVWEFAMHECEAGWNFRVRPIDIRRYGSFPFEIVRSGDVKAVKNLFATGELSVSDHEAGEWDLASKSMLTVSHNLSAYQSVEHSLDSGRRLQLKLVMSQSANSYYKSFQSAASTRKCTKL